MSGGSLRERMDGAGGDAEKPVLLTFRQNFSLPASASAATPCVIFFPFFYFTLLMLEQKAPCTTLCLKYSGVLI